MKRKYIIKKDVTRDRSDNWIIMDSAEFRVWKETPEGEIRKNNLGMLEACSEDDHIIFMECDDKTRTEWKSECHHKQYIRNINAESEYEVISYNAMHFEDDDINGEELIGDESCNVEEDVMHRIEVENLYAAIDKLDEEYKDIIIFFFFERNGRTLKDMLEKYHISKSEIYRMKDRAIGELRKKLS